MSEEKAIKQENVNKVTTLEELKQASTRVVDITGFEPGEVFKFRLRRASLMDLIVQGAIPNNLLNIVFEIFKIKAEKGTFNLFEELNPEKFIEYCSLVDAVCEAVMVEPTFDEVKNYLLDTQKLQIYNYAQYGLTVLHKFRSESEPDLAAGDNGKGVRTKTK